MSRFLIRESPIRVLTRSLVLSTRDKSSNGGEENFSDLVRRRRANSTTFYRYVLP